MTRPNEKEADRPNRQAALDYVRDFIAREYSHLYVSNDLKDILDHLVESLLDSRYAALAVARRDAALEEAALTIESMDNNLVSKTAAAQLIRGLKP